MRFLSRLVARLPVLARKALGSFVLRFVALGLQFLGAILIARQLGAAGFGAYGYAFTWATLIGTALGLGMGQLAIREVPRYLATADHGALRGFVLTWGLGLATTGLLVAGGMAALQMAGRLDLPVSWSLVVLAAVAHAVVLGLSALLSGFQRILQSQFLESILRQALFLGIILFCVGLGITLDPERVFQLTLLAVLPVILVMGWLVRRSMSRAMEAGVPPPAFSVLVWLTASVPLLLSTLAGQLQSSLDTLVLGVMVDDASLGLYRAAARGAELALIAQGLALQVLGPMLSRALATNNRTEAQSLISQSAVMSAGLGLTICAMLALLPEFYLGLFGAEFRAATRVLWILVGTEALSILCGPVALILVMLRREKLVLAITLAALVLNFGLKLLFVPLWGTIGAAASTFLSVAAFKLVLLGVVWRVGGFDPTLWTPLRRLVTGGPGRS